MHVRHISNPLTNLLLNHAYKQPYLSPNMQKVVYCNFVYTQYIIKSLSRRNIYIQKIVSYIIIFLLYKKKFDYTSH